MAGRFGYSLSSTQVATGSIVSSGAARNMTEPVLEADVRRIEARLRESRPGA